MIRRLNAVKDNKEPLKLVKELDAFPKIEPCYVETNARSGGGKCLWCQCKTMEWDCQLVTIIPFTHR